ncbi:MAG: hypothetical protein Q4E38_10665, partial [Eubacteriales bacterium]|nr:hypothetical protein [Eubacteriales bacterium]
VISDFKEPFSGAYLHKLFLTLFNFQGTFSSPPPLGGSLFMLPQEVVLVKNFFRFLKSFFDSAFQPHPAVLG